MSSELCKFFSDVRPLVSTDRLDRSLPLAKVRGGERPPELEPLLARLERGEQRQVIRACDADGLEVSHIEPRVSGVDDVVYLDQGRDRGVGGIGQGEALSGLLARVHKRLAQKLAEASMVPCCVEVSEDDVGMPVVCKLGDGGESLAPQSLTTLVR